MTNDEPSTSTPAVTINKSSSSRKYQIVTECQMPETHAADELHTNSVPTVGNNSPSKLPSLPAKWHAPLFKSESMQLPKSRTKLKRTFTQAASLKIEPQTTYIIPKTRLPAVGSTANDTEQKRHSEYQRRQIYALNQLMRELEQQKFREFFKLDETDGTAPEEIVVNTEDSLPQPSE